jgi:hypothetical protein
MFEAVANGLKKRVDAKLADELLDAYQGAKQNFYVGGLRLSAVEGGRFCEAAFRILEQVTTGKHTGLNHKLDTDRRAPGKWRNTLPGYGRPRRIRAPI